MGRKRYVQMYNNVTSKNGLTSLARLPVSFVIVKTTHVLHFPPPSFFRAVSRFALWAYGRNTDSLSSMYFQILFSHVALELCSTSLVLVVKYCPEE